MGVRRQDRLGRRPGRVEGRPLPEGDACAASNRMTLPADILGWMEESVGPVTDATRIPGGGMREGWFVDAGDRQLFLRWSPNPLPQNSAFHRLATEAEVVAALHRAGVQVPEVHAVHPTREAVLLDRIAGDTWFYLIKDHGEQVRVAQDFIRSLARIHTLKPDELGIDGLGPARSAREHALERIEGIRSRGTRADGSMDPLVRLCADWLEAPPRPRPRLRRAGRPRPGRHRPGQLPVSGRPGHRGPGLGAMPLGRSDGRHRLA